MNMNKLMLIRLVKQHFSRFLISFFLFCFTIMFNIDVSPPSTPGRIASFKKDSGTVWSLNSHNSSIETLAARFRCFKRPSEGKEGRLTKYLKRCLDVLQVIQ